jgi:UDP-N-acetylglucosamine 4,6-dehydratase
MRPGEKLHETLITESEARHTKEFDDSYIIEPEFSFWQKEDIGGKPLPECFSYSSDNNKEWLSVDDIRAMI